MKKVIVWMGLVLSVISFSACGQMVGEEEVVTELENLDEEEMSVEEDTAYKVYSSWHYDVEIEYWGEPWNDPTHEEESKIVFHERNHTIEMGIVSGNSYIISQVFYIADKIEEEEDLQEFVTEYLGENCMVTLFNDEGGRFGIESKVAPNFENNADPGGCGYLYFNKVSQFYDAETGLALMYRLPQDSAICFEEDGERVWVHNPFNVIKLGSIEFDSIEGSN